MSRKILLHHPSINDVIVVHHVGIMSTCHLTSPPLGQNDITVHAQKSVYQAGLRIGLHNLVPRLHNLATNCSSRVCLRGSSFNIFMPNNGITRHSISVSSKKGLCWITDRILYHLKYTTPCLTFLVPSHKVQFGFSSNQHSSIKCYVVNCTQKSKQNCRNPAFSNKSIPITTHCTHPSIFIKTCCGAKVKKFCTNNNRYALWNAAESKESTRN